MTEPVTEPKPQNPIVAIIVLVVAGFLIYNAVKLLFL